MKLGDYLTVVGEGFQVIMTVQADEAQLSAGIPATFDANLQVGTKDGKPVRLKSITLQEG